MCGEDITFWWRITLLIGKEVAKFRHTGMHLFMAGKPCKKHYHVYCPFCCSEKGLAYGAYGALLWHVMKCHLDDAVVFLGG